MDQLIKRPDAPAHAMRIKAVPRVVRVERNGEVIAESGSALRLTELGHDVYDPMFYIPKADLKVALPAVDGKTTHCPLKGDASYYEDETGETIAWSYDRPLDWAEQLKDLVAFYPDSVTIYEIGERSKA